MTGQQRTAIVTGAGRGIGAEIARRLASDGFRVAAIDLDHDGLDALTAGLTAAGHKAIGIVSDISDESAVDSAVARTADELGPPVVVVNNAGIIRDNLLYKMAVSDWDQVMNVHLRGSFLVSRAAQKHMVEAKWGRVINLSSTSALGNRGQANYSAAKAGLQGFTKTLALELGPFGVTANAIAPGFIETEMTASTAARLGVSFEDFTAKAASAIPVRRTGKPADIANAVSFFASDTAGFVSGQVLYVAGGPKA
ncbi:3-oxoacyl-ACP reductase FabG [Arthrobacter sp. I2-34]|uniref:3-oxoacyl-ACP reductase FabG n=1 Tax=Arthrobacter hankyongi TaxID=2904801 RepID=A0ABS9L8Z5_9MICC|nr:3-oxoacyl-ACP reductase FabG [Arthrobacter hankyongi]MCG2623120.1 3-oxoacyl-ACP reductase FabG [Arthrobacter hankyongi]